MSRTWNATFEAEPAGGDQGSTLDNKQRETRSEVRKRMDTLVDNWATDPDTPADLDLSDDAVLAEHISGLVSTGAVDMDNIPEGTTKGGVFVFDGDAEAPAGDYNDSGDAIVRVKEAITFLPTSGTLEIDGVEYAYTSVTVADKEFNLSGTLSAALSEDDPVYVKTTIRNLTIDSGLTITKPSAIRITETTAQTIPNNMTTIVKYADEEYDTFGEYDNVTNFRFTALVGGIYGVVAALHLASATYDAGEYVRLDVYKNGAIHSLIYRETTAAVNRAFFLIGSTQVQLDAGEYIDIRVKHNRGDSVDTGTNAADNYLAIHKLS